MPLDLDPLDPAFNAHACYQMARCSELAYAGPKALEKALGKDFDEIEFIEVGATQCYIGYSSSMILLAFRGTQLDQLQDIIDDLKFGKTRGPLAGEVHEGFLEALQRVWLDRHTSKGKRWVGVRSRITDAWERFRPDHGPHPRLWITGHSLGAALATLAGAYFLEPDRVFNLYTYGSPRVGTLRFADTFNARAHGFTKRVANNADLVPRMPLRTQGFGHVGQLVYITEKGDLTFDPSAWFQVLDMAYGSASDIFELGLDAFKDHSINSGKDGYVPALKKHHKPARRKRK